jgi:hypothetical protein
LQLNIQMYMYREENTSDKKQKTAWKYVQQKTWENLNKFDVVFKTNFCKLRQISSKETIFNIQWTTESRNYLTTGVFL